MRDTFSMANNPKRPRDPIALAKLIGDIATGEVVDAVFGAITGALKAKEEVRLVGFGTFAAAVRKASTGRNPRTGEEMAIPESTTVRFKAGKGLKDSVG